MSKYLLSGIENGIISFYEFTKQLNSSFKLEDQDRENHYQFCYHSATYLSHSIGLEMVSLETDLEVPAT